MTNVGQYQSKFHVVIAGSNLYTQTVPATPGNFSMQAYGNYTANAPGFMGSQTFSQTQPYDPSICAQACDAKSAFDIQQNLPSADKPDICKEFIAYMLYQNDQNGVFTCTYYNQAIDPSYFTNNGQFDGQGNKYTIGNSFAFPRKCLYPASC